MRTLEMTSGPGFLGSLADTPLAEVFQRIAQEGKSGDLQITLQKAIKTIYFDRGFVVFASSNLKNDRLGESMIEAGRISRHEFALATMVMKSSKRKFGETLVAAGIVSEEELGQSVARQVNRIVLSLFSAKEGMYSFDERACTIPVELMVSLSVYRILLEGTRRMTSKKLVLAGLPALGSKLAIASDPPFSLDVEKLRAVEKDVLRAAGEGAPISEIVRMVGGNDGVALRAIYGLFCAGVLELAAAEAPSRILKVQEETGSFVLSEIRRKVEARREAEEDERGAEPESIAVREPVIDLQAVEELETPAPEIEPEPPPPAAAPVAPPTPPSIRPARPSRLLALWRAIWEPIEAALLRWVGSTAEMPQEIEPPPPAPSFSRQPAVTPAPRAPVEEEPETAVRDVKEEVGVPSWSMASAQESPDEPEEEAPEPLRMEAPSWSIQDDERDVESGASVLHGEVGVPSWSILDPGEPETPPEAVPLSALDSELFIEEEEALEEEPSMLSQIPVEEIAISEEPLEIEIEVVEDPLPTPESGRIEEPPPEVERAPAPAIAAPSRDHHPSLPADDAPSQEERAASSREDAMRRMKQSGGEGRLLRDVKLHFQLKDWEGAVPLLEQLVAISPGTALYRGMMARAMSRIPRLKKNAEEHFIEALRLAPQDPELHYWLGLYYKSFGLGSRALTEFRTTLRIDPKHEGARKQLGGARKDDALGGVLKKIFG